MGQPLLLGGTTPPAIHSGHRQGPYDQPEDLRYHLRASERSRDGGDVAGRREDGRATCSGCAVLLCLYSWAQRAAKPPPRGKARHFCTGYSFLTRRAPSRGFQRSSAHLRQHLWSLIPCVWEGRQILPRCSSCSLCRTMRSGHVVMTASKG